MSHFNDWNSAQCLRFIWGSRSSSEIKARAYNMTGLNPCNPSLKGGLNMAIETEYSCPMHPEIRRQEPGTCPVCGMELEPVSPIVEKGKKPFGISYAMSSDINIKIRRRQK
jgi:hypothetical protein